MKLKRAKLEIGKKYDIQCHSTGIFFGTSTELDYKKDSSRMTWVFSYKNLSTI